MIKNNFFSAILKYVKQSKVFCSPGPILRTVCGVLTPIVIETLEETAYVRFVSDAAENSESGFSMNYIASEDGGLVFYLLEYF